MIPLRSWLGLKHVKKIKIVSVLLRPENTGKTGVAGIGIQVMSIFVK